MSKFIVIEGIDGSGKSTQAGRLVLSFGLDDATDGGARAFLTREPTWAYTDEDGVPLAYLTSDPWEAALLFAADRRAHQSEITANLARRPVICDRYSPSMWAYQSASGVDLDWLIALDRGCRVPDLTIHLDVPVDVAMACLAGKPGANHNADRLHRVSAAYGVVIERARRDGWRIDRLDGTGTEDQVFARVLASVGRVL